MIAEGLYPVPVVVITPFAQERRHADRILDECLTVDDPATLTTNGADFYLIRVWGQESRMVYAGPIWVEANMN